MKSSCPSCLPIPGFGRFSLPQWCLSSLPSLYPVALQPGDNRHSNEWVKGVLIHQLCPLEVYSLWNFMGTPLGASSSSHPLSPFLLLASTLELLQSPRGRTQELSPQRMPSFILVRSGCQRRGCGWKRPHGHFSPCLQAAEQSSKPSLTSQHFHPQGIC